MRPPRRLETRRSKEAELRHPSSCLLLLLLLLSPSYSCAVCFSVTSYGLRFLTSCLLDSRSSRKLVNYRLSAWPDLHSPLPAITRKTSLVYTHISDPIWSLHLLTTDKIRIRVSKENFLLQVSFFFVSLRSCCSTWDRTRLELLLKLETS